MGLLGAIYAHLTAGASPLTVATGFTLAFALCVALCAVVAKLCRRWGLVDVPEPRRIHQSPAPRLGGVAIFAAFVAVSLALYKPANSYERHIYVGLLLAALVVVGVMTYDDLRGLPPLPRLGAQSVAALIAIFPAQRGALIEVLHNPLVAAHHGRTYLPLWIAVPFTWFWIVGMMNTINWVDGSDGLAGGVVTITALVMATISWLLGQHTTALLCAILAGATLGFLMLNWHPARLFMGDCGAMFLGLALAILANVGGSKLAAMLLLLSLPILDAARVTVRRLRQGRSPLRSDRSHLHHRLLAGGFSQRQIALLFYVVTATFGGVTILAAAIETNGAAWQSQAMARWLHFALGVAPILVALALTVSAALVIWWLVTIRRKPRSAASESPLESRHSPEPLPSASGGQRV